MESFNGSLEEKEACIRLTDEAIEFLHSKESLVGHFKDKTSNKISINTDDLESCLFRFGSGLPSWLRILAESVYMNLGGGDRLDFCEGFWRVIPVGVDLGKMERPLMKGIVDYFDQEDSGDPVASKCYEVIKIFLEVGSAIKECPLILERHSRPLPLKNILKLSKHLIEIGYFPMVPRYFSDALFLFCDSPESKSLFVNAFADHILKTLEFAQENSM